MTTAAAIDRLVHHSVIVELNVPSYRLEQARHNVQTVDHTTPEPSSGETGFLLRAPPSASSRFTRAPPRCRQQLMTVDVVRRKK
jgi:hypothetical protein